MRTTHAVTFAATLLLAAAARAQKMDLGDRSQRQVAVFDVGTLLGEPMPDPVLPAAAAGPAPTRSAATLRAQQSTIVEFVRAFVATDSARADVQPLGDRHVVAMGTAPQVAAVERLLAHLRTTTAKQFYFDVRIATVPAAVFAASVRDKLAPAGGDADAAQRTCVLDRTAADDLLRSLKKQDAGVAITQFPQVVALDLQTAHLVVGTKLALVRDFEISVAGGGFEPKPVRDEVIDGFDANVVCAEVAPGRVGVSMSLLAQTVEQPIPERTATIPGSTLQVTVQVPHITGCRGSQTVELANGATAAMAARKPDGSWLLTLLTVHTIHPEGNAVFRR